MLAPIVAADLGSDRRKVPDLTDAVTRKRLSPAAIAAFFQIVEKWGVKNDEAMLLLGGISHGRYYALKKSGRGVLTQDELTRVSLLIGIFKALNILFQKRLANQWVSRPNSNPLFHDASPIEAMKQGGVPGMLEVRRLLDARRGGR